jgi:hypothetical protein
MLRIVTTNFCINNILNNRVTRDVSSSLVYLDRPAWPQRWQKQRPQREQLAGPQNGQQSDKFLSHLDATDAVASFPSSLQLKIAEDVAKGNQFYIVAYIRSFSLFDAGYKLTSKSSIV